MSYFAPLAAPEFTFVEHGLRRGARTRKQSNDQNEFGKDNTEGTKYDVKVVCSKSLRKVL